MIGLAFAGSSPGLVRAIRAARRGVGWAWPDPALGIDWAPPSGPPLTEYRRGPGDDPVRRMLERLEAASAPAGGVLSLTSMPGPEARDRLLRTSVAAIELGIGGGEENDPRVRGDRAPGAIWRLNRVPWYRAATGRPLIIAKSAASLDGRTATRAGISQWITGPRARWWGRSLRAEVDAIVVGVGTIGADDPQLTTRRAGARDPVRVVFDSSLRLSLDARVVKTAGSPPTWVMTRREMLGSDRARALRSRGVRIEGLPDGPDGRPDPRAAVQRWAEQGWAGVLLEGGAELQGAFVDADLVDWVCWFLAPLILGGVTARGAIGGEGAKTPDQGLRLEEPRILKLGPDLCIEGWVQGHRPRGPASSIP